MPSNDEPTTPRGSAKTDIVLERMNSLRSDMLDVKASTKDTEQKVDALKDAFSSFQVYYTREHEKLCSDVTDHSEALKDYGERIQKLEDAVGPLIFANRVAVWIAGVLGLSVVALIWGILLHQVQIVIP